MVAIRQGCACGSLFLAGDTAVAVPLVKPRNNIAGEKDDTRALEKTRNYAISEMAPEKTGVQSKSPQHATPSARGVDQGTCDRNELLAYPVYAIRPICGGTERSKSTFVFVLSKPTGDPQMSLEIGKSSLSQPGYAAFA